jgi:hypothetical protein
VVGPCGLTVSHVESARTRPNVAGVYDQHVQGLPKGGNDGCRPLIAPHFNLTVEIPLKTIVRHGLSFQLLGAIGGRVKQKTKLLLKEMG